MKNYFIIAAAALAVAASCAKTEEPELSSEESLVTFTAQLPEDIATKAISDGTTANVLDYAVYEKDQTKVLLTGTQNIPLKTTVSLKLVTGKKYDVIFWAHAKESPYTFNKGAQTVTVDYTSPAANDETRDAFFKMETIEVTGALTKTVKLKRPFAQLNVATDDYDAAVKAGTTVSKSSLKVGKIYTTLNLADGTVSGETEVAFGLASIPTETIAINGKDYTWLEMSYLLVSADKSLVDCEITLNNDDASYTKSLTVTDVPVQRNYRTNIYGSLLTSSVTYTVEIEPAFNKTDYNNVSVSDADGLANAIANGMDVTLTADVEITTPLKVSDGQTVTINLNGKKITNTTEDKTKSTEVFIVSNGTLNIEGDGDVQALAEDSDNDGYREVVTASGTGIVNIYGGNYYNKQKVNAQLDLIYAKDSGQINIYGGTFESGCYDSKGRYWVLNRKNNTDSKITVYGGTFVNFDPANPNTDDDSSYVADGYTSTSTTVDGKTAYVVSASE